MATWTQYQKLVKHKRVTYVCGVERLLVEEVVTAIRSRVAAKPMDTLTLTVPENNEAVVWATLNQYPSVAHAQRFILVRGADSIKNWKPFMSWLEDAKLMPTTHVVLVSEKPGHDTEQPHLELIHRRGQLVKCSTPAPAELVKWVQAKLPCSPEVATTLLDRVGGDLGAASSVIMKLALFNGEPSAELVEALCAEAPSRDFELSLIAGQKERALSALESLPVREYSRVIGLLDSRLDLLARLCGLLKTVRVQWKIVAAAGAPPFVVSMLLPYAKNYEAGRVVQLRQAMVVVDDAVRSGVRVGPMEALVAAW